MLKTEEKTQPLEFMICQKVAEGICTGLKLFPDEDGNSGEKDESGYDIYKKGTSLYISDTVPEDFVVAVEDAMEFVVRNLTLEKDTNKNFFIESQVEFLPNGFYKAVEDLVKKRLPVFSNFYAQWRNYFGCSLSDIDFIDQYIKRSMNMVDVTKINEARFSLDGARSGIMNIAKVLGITSSIEGRGLLGTVDSLINMADMKMSNPSMNVFSNNGPDSIEDEENFLKEAIEIDGRVRLLEEAVRMILTGEMDEMRASIDYTRGTTEVIERIRRETARITKGRGIYNYG